MHTDSRISPSLEADEHAFRGDRARDRRDRIVLCYFLAALVYMIVALPAGMLYSLQFLQAYPFRGIEVFSPGRWRMVHTTTMTYGFLFNALIGGVHWVAATVGARRVSSERLSVLVFVIWQVVVLSTVAGLLAGSAQAIGWSETPVWIDPLVIAGLVLLAVNVLMPILQTDRTICMTIRYVSFALAWSVSAYAIGNLVPQYFAGGAAGGAIAGLFGHAFIDVFAMAIGWGLLYYFVPAILSTPVANRRLALLGFWGLVILYPLGGICHFLYSPIPAYMQVGSIIATVGGAIAILATVAVFAAMISGKVAFLRENPAIRWFYAGMIFCGLACVQRICEVAPALQRTVHFTDWEIGRSHVLIFGAFGFWALGMMTHLLPRLLHATAWFCPSWNTWHFRLSCIGVLVMALDLAVAGLIQGSHWQDLAPWEASIVASVPHWLTRSLAGAVIIVGQLLFVYNVALTALHMRDRPIGSSAVRANPLRGSDDDSNTHGEPFAPGSKKTTLIIAGIGLCGPVVVSLGLATILVPSNLPEQAIEDVARDGIIHEFVELRERFPDRFATYYGTVGYESYASALARGRDIYVEEACWHCHSQYVRPVANDSLRFGLVSEAREYRSVLHRPVLWGTRRVGPDLARAASRHANDWHIAHFFKPTSVVPVSVMPEYPWFFDEQGYPNRDGMAIITYVQWLGSWSGDQPPLGGETSNGSAVDLDNP